MEHLLPGESVDRHPHLQSKRCRFVFPGGEGAFIEISRDDQGKIDDTPMKRFVRRRDVWQISNWPLISAVPDNVRVQFETAKNLILYSWFVFEFQSIAEMQAYAALELGLRERLKNPTRTIVSKNKTKTIPLMLAELLSKAVNEGLILPEKLPSWEWTKKKREWFTKQFGGQAQQFSAEDWFQLIKNNLPSSRNHLAHGNPQLHLFHSFSQLELCGDLINALFDH